MRVTLQYNSTYHPQNDGQTERANQCLENYLGCMAFKEPKKLLHWLPLAKWWYNTTYHSSLKCTPFEALYSYSPPMISKIMIPGPESPIVDFLLQKQQMIEKLKANLTQAQARMKKYADLKRTEREFSPGNMVYLRRQTFRQHGMGLHQNLKLTTMYYCPFRVLERIGLAAYRIQLPTTVDIHPMLHVSQLKKHIGSKVIRQPNPPLITPEGYVKTGHVAVLETRALPHQDEVVTQWKVQWHNLTA
jgi:hypothetical protein